MSERFREVDRQIAQERYEAAREALAGMTPEPGATFGARLRTIRLQLIDGDEPLDEAIFALQELIADANTDHTPPSRADHEQAYGLLAQCFTTKGCPGLAAQVEDQGQATLGPSAEIERRRGNRRLALDDRPGAAQDYRRALELDPENGHTKYALANLDYVLGQFESARRRIGTISDSDPAWFKAARLRAATYAAQQRFDDEARQWQQITRRYPDRASAMSDRISYALALAAASQRSAALEQLRAAWRLDPDGGYGRYARQRIEYLEATPADAQRQRLPAFPTTSQKRNYCGPAVLELCLRYLDFDLGQDEIATVVRRGDGTPMHEIVEYLKAHNIVARRIEATPDRLRSAVDLGLPVIVQEEYSTMCHVAVITGYDDSLGMLVANDPATHRQLLKSFDWMRNAGDLFGNGGIIVLGRDGPQLEPLMKRCDAAGLVEAKHLVLLDECDRIRVGGLGEENQEAAPEEIIRLCDEALDLEPNFKLAWYRRTWAWARLAESSRPSGIQERTLTALQQVRTRFPSDEWPHQIHGHILRQNALYEEAFVAYFEAWQRDEDDADNLAAMGQCKWLAGDLEQAEQCLVDALRVDPSHSIAARHLAAVYLRELEHRDQQRGETLVDDDPFTYATLATPPELTSNIERNTSDVVRRAEHFSKIALETAPDDPFNWAVAGTLSARAREFREAATAFRSSLKLANDRPWTIIGYAGCLELLGEASTAQKLLAESCESLWSHGSLWLSLANTRARDDNEPAAIDALSHAIEAGADDRETIARRLFSLIAQTQSAEAAAARLRALAEEQRADGPFVRDVAWLLDHHGQRGHAIALFRHVIAQAPSDVAAIYQLGRLLTDSVNTRDEGRQLLERALELAPGHPLPRVRLAWLVGQQGDFEHALALLAPVEDSEDTFVWETKAAHLDKLGRPQEAREALERALAFGGDAVQARLTLIDWHAHNYRYARAYALARDLDLRHVSPDDRPWAERTWLKAHRLLGIVRPIVEDVRRLCENGKVPGHLAFEIYYGYRSLDRQLAAAAASCLARDADPGEAMAWKVRAAGLLAKDGDGAPLRRVRDEAGDNAEAWSALVYVYDDLRRPQDAKAAAARASQLDPDDREVLAALEHLAGEHGEPEAQMGYARRLFELYPYEHQGAERLGWLLAKHGNIPEALELSLRAVDAAPYCHLAHTCRAIATFMSGDYGLAYEHATQAGQMEPSEEEFDDRSLVLVALSGDIERLETLLAQRSEKHPHPYPKFEAQLRATAAQPPLLDQDQANTN